ncbi:MAG: hypothetical protein DRP08_08235 [Candidatus Aenigmatarchaeota archaeon]|nr:MAG: hypothetical protein DRP08_08235 [Candidatus Aenigmarchaeota archaeon]
MRRRIVRRRSSGRRGVATPRLNRFAREAPSDARVIRRPRAKFMEGEIIVPRSHTEIILNDRGRRALKKLTPEEERLLSLDLTMGGGYDNEEGIIYIVHTPGYPVYKQWRKIHALLNKAESRRK